MVRFNLYPRIATFRKKKSATVKLLFNLIEDFLARIMTHGILPLQTEWVVAFLV